MKSVYHSIISTLEREHAGLINLSPEDLAQLERTAAIFDSRYPPRLDPSPALRRPIDRERRRIEDSWRIPEGLIRDLNTPKQGALGLGEGLGLSNGAKRAATIPAANLHTSKAWLTATLEYRPGTLHLKVSGKFTPQPGKSKRGEIRRISYASGRRLQNVVRELEKEDMWPEFMLTATYPADWQGALGADPAFLREYQAALRDLKKKTRLFTEAKRRAEASGYWPPNYDLLEEAYQDALRRVGRKAKELMRKLPDGSLVKRHLNAFLKRFDRRFGYRELATTPDRESAEALAAHIEKQGKYPMVKVLKRKRGGYKVVAVLYRVLWWMEFQRRGAPHLHFLFFDVVGIELDAVRRWTSTAWTGVVFGMRSLEQYFAAEVGNAYDTLRELWGRVTGESFFAEWLEARGLDIEVWKHLRAGTRVEKMRKKTWGYVAKEVSGGKAKAYQRRVPKLYRNIGRWWGYRNYRRKKSQKLKIPMVNVEAVRLLLDVIAKAETLMPEQAFRYRKKLERARKAIKNGELYAYLTIWGDAGEQAMATAQKALAA